jgi:hypothetical protein
MDLPGTWILEVGLNVTCTMTSCPEEIPPRTPPALLLRKPVGVSSSRCSLPRCAAEATPAPISTA